MRKMISGADQEALKRLKNNIVVNESGSQIEVGGNVAFESIEQVGAMVTVPASNAEVEATVETQVVTAELTIATNVNIEECVFIGDDWTEASFDGRIDINDNECRIAQNLSENKWCIAIQPPFAQGVKTKVFYLNQGNAGKVVLNAGATISTYAKNFEGFKPAQDEHLEFKSFFTEEQYQAILDLIA